MLYGSIFNYLILFVIILINTWEFLYSVTQKCFSTEVYIFILLPVP